MEEVTQTIRQTSTVPLFPYGSANYSAFRVPNHREHKELTDVLEEAQAHQDDSRSNVDATPVPNWALFSGGLKDDTAGMNVPAEREYSARQYAKAGHTRLCTKLQQLINASADADVIIQERQILSNVALDFIAHHTEYITGMGSEATKEDLTHKTNILVRLTTRTRPSPRK